MKIILKKYAIPLIGGITLIILLTINRLIQGIDFNAKELLLWFIIILNTVFVRTCDDIFDYEEDIKKGKKVIPLMASCLFFTCTITLTLLVDILMGSILALVFSIIYIIYILIAFYKKNKNLKIYIFPLLFITNTINLIYIYQNEINIYNTLIYTLITCVITLIGSLIFGLVKKG